MSTQRSVARTLSERDDDRLARILDDYLAALERGSAITPESVLARFPADAEKLRGYLSGLRLFHNAIVPAPGTPATQSLPAHLESAKVIGDYRIVREIGRGGMGVVYEAWQTSLHRRVALKILPFTVANDAKQIGRFKNEAQAAAQVQHPNIVPVYAVGEESGVHYYAMQLIEGQWLTSLLGNLPLPEGEGLITASPFTSSESADHIRAIARLGVQAAQALHAAHEYGVVHRDVKPSNLLLDDQGKLWITDFGLARCRRASSLTQTGDVLGTMRYMSPEQARGRTALIDHRTDIYSLGVTLYELATLHHPCDGDADGDALLLFSNEERTPKPLRHWDRYIAVDFQTIVLKSLAENPWERYNSAQDLADDLMRFLDGKPILASPPSVLNRTHKWLRRHRRKVFAAAALLVSASITLSMFFAHETAEAVRTKDEIRQSTRHAFTAIDRLARLGDELAPIPGAEGVRNKLYNDLLSLYRQVQEQAIDDPSLVTDRALAYSKSGSLFEKLNDKDRALESHRMALQIWQQRARREAANAEYARNLALCQNNLGLLLAEMDQPAQGLELLTQAARSQANGDHSLALATERATTHNNLGLVHSQLGDKSKAVKNFKVAIEINSPLVDSSAADENALRTLAASYNNLASLQAGKGAADAATTYQKAISIQLRLAKHQPNNRIHQADLARTYNNLGFLAAGRKEWRKAELSYSEAILLQENLVRFSPSAAAYSRDLAISFNNLGMVQSRAGRLREAESSFQKAVQLQQKLVAAQPRDVQALSNQGSVLNNLGLLLDKQHRHADAEAMYRQAITVQSKAQHEAPASETIRTLLSRHYTNLATNLDVQSKHDDAILIALERQKLLAARGLASPSHRLQNAKSTP